MVSQAAPFVFSARLQTLTRLVEWPGRMWLLTLYTEGTKAPHFIVNVPGASTDKMGAIQAPEPKFGAGTS